MDITKILEYQKLDSELFKLEKALRDNPNKKIASEMSNNAKMAQQRSVGLEKKAGELLAEVDTVKKQFQIQTDKMKQVMAKDVDSMSKEEVEAMLSLKDKLSQNLNILDKNLTKLAESVNAVLADFNKTIKTYNLAKEKFTQSKTAYDKDVEAVEPKKVELEKGLVKLEKGIDSSLMEKYKKRRNDNLFPVLVPLKGGRSCGGCHMELPAAEVAKLKTEGILSCEHCRRIIYYAED